MLCQNCHKNPATIHLTTNLNGRQTSIDLCQNCYQEIKNEANGFNNIGQDPFGFGSLDDIFKAISNPNFSNQQSMSQEPPTQSGRIGGNNGNRNGDSSILGQYGLDLTEEAKNGQIDPVIGRDKEIARVIEILNRRTKNNPVLIGEAGVGKTAVVEGLAQKIVNSDVPQKLIGKKVIRLDVVSLVQGTGIRGQFEQRMQQLMKELKQQKDVILFIDEIHEIVGAGNAEGGMDAGNVLKPSLARGEFQLVGATTLNEFRTIEKDAALARRLQPVQVDEPSVEETIKILNGIRNKYEAYHHVKYTDEALKAAVTLSNRYIQDRFLPDKAIDLLDESGSRKNLTIHATDPKIIEERIKNAENQKQAALKEENYEKAAYYRDQVSRFEKMKDNASDEDTPVVTEKDMEHIIEEKTNIPVGELKAKEKEQLRDLGSSLEKHVIGQDEAVDKVARSIRRNRIGFNKSGRPIGSFLFVGPTGVGKTETAKQLARELFGTEDSMIRFDMSEYMEKFSVSKLIGSPPGYVGYEEARQLTEQVRRHPYSLILLDEVEKAHNDVFNILLQVLDDGFLTDSKGRKVDFRNTIIIMTSNLGATALRDEKSVGFGAKDVSDDYEAMAAKVRETLKKTFRPEFLNRLDETVVFHSLNKEEIHQIVKLMAKNIIDRIKEQNINLKITPSAIDIVAEAGFDAEYGARPIRRILQDKIEDLLSEELLAGNIETGATVTIGAKKGEITIKVKNPVAAEKINS